MGFQMGLKQVKLGIFITGSGQCPQERLDLYFLLHGACNVMRLPIHMAQLQVNINWGFDAWRSYKVCICLSLQQCLENSRTTPSMPHWSARKSTFSIASPHAMYMFFWRMPRSSQKSKSLPFPSILMPENQPKHPAVFLLAFQVGFFTDFLGCVATQNHFTNRINGPQTGVCFVR